MPSINMIAARRAEKKRLERLISIAMLVILCQLAAALCMFGFMTARVHAANRTSAVLEARLNEIQPVVERIQRYESDIRELTPRLELLSDSRERTLLWYSILHNLGHVMPEKTWLTSLSSTETRVGTSQDAPPPVVNISGVAASQANVGETMLRLNDFPEFGRVDLSYTQDGGQGSFDSIQFQIVANVNAKQPSRGGASNED